MRDKTDETSDVVAEGRLSETQQLQPQQVDAVRRGAFDVLGAYRSEYHAAGVYPFRRGDGHPDRPDGFTGRAAVGPAMPVVEMPYVAPVARRTPSAICSATLRLTAPYRFRLSGSTPSSAVFTSFE